MRAPCHLLRVNVLGGAACAVASLLLAMPAATVAKRPRAEKLARTTVFAVDGVAEARIVVRRPVTVSTAFQDNPSVSIDGSGKIGGLALFQETSDPDDAVEVVAFRGPDACLAHYDRCDGGDDQVVVHSLDFGSPGDVELPAGRYHVVVFGDASTRVTLRAPDLRGRRTVRRLEPVTGGEARAMPRLDDPRVDEALVYGDQYAMPGRGIAVFAGAIMLSADTVDGIEFCRYVGAAPFAAFQRGCSLRDTPPGWVIWGGVSPAVGSGAQVVIWPYSIATSIPPGLNAVGGNFTAAGDVLSFAGGIAWIPRPG